MPIFAKLFVLSGTICLVVAAQTVAIGFSPVPLWPKDGDTSKYPGKSVFFDLQNNQYIVKTSDKASGDSAVLRVPSHKQVDPTVHVSVTKRSDGLYEYGYEVQNGPRALTSMDLVTIILEQQTEKTTAPHPTWVSNISRERPIGVPLSAYGTITWQSDKADPVKPGGTALVLTVVSDLAPGFTLISFHGKSELPEPDPLTLSRLPQDTQAQLMACKTLGWDTQTRTVIGPRFSPVLGAQQAIAANFRFGFGTLNRRDRVLGGSDKLNSFDNVLGPAAEGVATIDPAALDNLKASASPDEQAAIDALKLTLAAAKDYRGAAPPY